MAVHPEYQRRGIGRQLLTEICMLAEKAAQDIYLEATPAGTKLYLNAGFERIGAIELLGGQYELACMMRKASSTL
jgi:ribosomal protein S18 acetylase RimI-like enzyme